MAQTHRTIKTKIDKKKYEIELHQCSVSDTTAIYTESFMDATVVHIDDAIKIAAGLIEMYRYRGYSIDKQFKKIRKLIEKWDEQSS